MSFYDRWKKRLRAAKPVRSAIYATHKLRLPGFQGLSLYQVLAFLIEGIRMGRITTRASAVSFRMLLALPPFLIVLLSTIPFIPIDDFQENLMGGIARLMPESAFELVEQTLDDLINQKQQTLISISFMLALFYSSNAITAILDSFSHSYHTVKERGFLMQYVTAFGLMILLSLMVVVGVGLITFSSPIFAYLREVNIIGHDIFVFLLEIAKWILVVLLFELGISLLYRAGHTGKWRAFNAGATFATVGLIIVSLLFAWFVNNFGNYNKLYGSVGSILVVMLWLYFNTIVLLIGFEINTSIETAKGQKIESLDPEKAMRRSRKM
ncbi:MAG: YihY/virulence factor BrkB family protein [Cryomorphaceae bacterium]|nr:YihY/virulence factor BrkB family protein [Flavobacteriales bacterium]